MEIIELENGSKIRIRKEDLLPHHKSLVVKDTIEVKKEKAPKEKAVTEDEKEETKLNEEV